ncbi:MAG: hypothetical protein E6R03_03945 [Hyphomicrobiaceae bacterium]|nr:MAG: hypothetical protein E6R03_03945 [Hyphomicrobiaceae bacterium]
MTVTISMPPVNAESSEETMRDMGRLGSHIVGHYWLLGGTHYVWYTHDGSGFDPGDFDAALAALDGIEVTLAAGNRTAAQVATATASAIDGEGTYAAVADGVEVTVTGTDEAEAGARDWDEAGDFGLRGMQTYNLAGLNSFPNAATSGALLNPTSLPVDPIIVTGFRVSVSAVHDAQMTVALYQGGVSDTDFTGAVLLGALGATSGTATATTLYVPATAPFEVDPGAGRVWVLWSHDAGDFEAPYPLTIESNPDHVAAIATCDWVITADQCTYEANTIPLSSDPTDWPGVLPAVTNTTVGVPSIAISFVSAADFQCNMRVVGRIGTRAAADALTGTSQATLLVGNSFTTPANVGMTVLDASVNYFWHEPDDHYRLSLAVGGAANNNFSGADFTDIGIADGPGTGWVDVEPAPGTIAIPASSRIFITIHHTTGVPDSSVLAFDQGAPNAYGPADNPAAYYNGNTTESEADNGFLGGAPSTITFDENVPQSGVVIIDGTNYNNNNNVGVRMRYAVEGFAVVV